MKNKLYSRALVSIAMILMLASIAGAAPFAYITNPGSNNVSVIDTATDNVTATVDIGSSPYGVAVNPAGTKVYITNPGSNNVSVIDTATNIVTATVNVGASPFGVAVNPEGTKIYVANQGSGTVSVIDTATNKVAATVPVGSSPEGVVVSSDGKTVYVTVSNQSRCSLEDGCPGPLQGNSTVSVINTSTNTVISTVNVATDPSGYTSHGVSVNPEGTKVYVAVAKLNPMTLNPSRLCVIDTATNKVAANTYVGEEPYGVAVDPTGTKVYVTNVYSNDVSVIDTATNNVIATVPVGRGPYGVSVTPDGTKVYVANAGSNTTSVIDTATNTVIATINVGNQPAAFGQFIVPPIRLLVASFSTNVTSGYAPLTVQFTDRSINATRWNWNFGDGINSTQQNPVHTYSEAGNYNVNLTVSNANSTDSKLATISVHAKKYTFVNKWGSYGTGDGQFIYPRDVTVDSSGNVYVADSDNNRIEKFDSNGNYLTKWGSKGTGDGQFYNPYGVAVDSSGNVYVADTNNNRTQKFDSSGTFLAKWGSYGTGDGQFKYPHGIAVDSSGNVYVADTNNHRIEKFDSNGTFLTKWGSRGSGDGQFKNQYGVAVDSSGNVYVADMYNNRIQKFDSNGTFLANWGSYGTGDGQFYYPRGVAVDSSGNVYVADTDNNRIQKFDSNGTFLARLGSYGTGDGQLNYPQGVAVDYSGNVYVADTNNHRIQKFSPVISGLPVANFTSNVTSGKDPLTVQFTDLSTNATSWYWDFGDGFNSTEQNPIHTYSTAGNYTVNLTVSNGNGKDSKLATITVEAVPEKPIASFSETPTSGNAPVTVNFTDTSTGIPTWWKWSFGDGIYSTQQNPVHTYNRVGKYTVNLIVGNNYGINSVTKQNYITVTSPLTAPAANFSATPVSGSRPLKVTFIDISTGSPNSWIWSFGDGTYSTQQNPEHTYSRAGKYNVSLTARNSKGSNTKTMSGYIIVNE